MVEIYIYSSICLREPRGNLEDDLASILGSAVTVTGGGGGDRGWNIDLEVDNVALPDPIEKVKAFLRGWGVPPDTHLDVWDSAEKRTRHDVYDTGEVMDWINTTLAFLAERLATNPTGWRDVEREIQGKLSELEARVIRSAGTEQASQDL